MPEEKELFELERLEEIKIIKEVKVKGKNIRNLNKLEIIRKIIRCGKKYIELCDSLTDKHKIFCDRKISLWETEDDSETSNKKAKIAFEKSKKEFEKAKSALLIKMIKYKEDKDLKKSFKKALKIPAFPDSRPRPGRDRHSGGR